MKLPTGSIMTFCCSHTFFVTFKAKENLTLHIYFRCNDLEIFKTRRKELLESFKSSLEFHYFNQTFTEPHYAFEKTFLTFQVDDRSLSQY